MGRHGRPVEGRPRRRGPPALERIGAPFPSGEISARAASRFIFGGFSGSRSRERRGTFRGCVRRGNHRCCDRLLSTRKMALTTRANHGNLYLSGADTPHMVVRCRGGDEILPDRGGGTRVRRPAGIGFMLVCQGDRQAAGLPRGCEFVPVGRMSRASGPKGQRSTPGHGPDREEGCGRHEHAQGPEPRPFTIR